MTSWKMLERAGVFALVLMIMASGLAYAGNNLTVKASPANGGDVFGSVNNLPVNSTARIWAAANANYTFANWSKSGDCFIAVANNANTTVRVVSGNCIATANFAQRRQAAVNLTVRASPANGGSVSGSASNFAANSSRQISASANVNYTFSHWSNFGNCFVAANKSNTTVKVISGDCVATANFNALRNARRLNETNMTNGTGNNLTVRASPANGGMVNGTAGNITNGTRQISASANANYNFSNWSVSGNCSINATNKTNTTVKVGSGPCVATANFVQTRQVRELNQTNVTNNSRITAIVKPSINGSSDEINGTNVNDSNRSTGAFVAGGISGRINQMNTNNTSNSRVAAAKCPPLSIPSCTGRTKLAFGPTCTIKQVNGKPNYSFDISSSNEVFPNFSFHISSK